MTGKLDIEDASSLLAYLRAKGRLAISEEPELTTLSGGVSNRAVLLRRPTGEAWVIKQALPRLRVRVEWLSDPRRIEREALGMRRLGEITSAGTVPILLFLDPDEHLLAMSAVPQPHENWKSMLLDGRLQPRHVEQFAVNLATIHRAGWERRDLFAKEFDDRSFFESLRLEPYYLYSAQRMPTVAGFLEALVRRTRSTRLTLVHGDYSPKNILVHDDRLVLLDHEVIHFGDPAFDVGFALTHLLSKAHFLVDQRAQLIKASLDLWQVYFQTLGRVPWKAELEPRAVAHLAACLLARCIGRSPLEYLTAPAAALQANLASDLMLTTPPTSIDGLILRFSDELSES